MKVPKIKIDPGFSPENQNFNKLLYKKLIDIKNNKSDIDILNGVIFLTVSSNDNDSVFRIDEDSIYITAPG